MVRRFPLTIDREIIRLSIPTILSNITIPLLGICDTAISGHLGSELFLSAIAVGSVMLNVVLWIFGFLRGGTTGLTANALGAGNEKELFRVLYRAILISFLAGAILIGFQSYIFKGLWIISGSGEDILQLVEDYFKIRILGSPALLAVIAISGWFVGMQNTVCPMVIAISTNVLNVVISYLLSFEGGYGFSGVAIGTLVANWLGLGIAVGCMIWFRRGKFERFSLRHLLIGDWWRYFSVNGNLFLRSLCIICVTMGVTAAGAKIGNLILAVNIVIMQFFQFFSFFMDGFAYSAEAMIGLRVGERNWIMLKKCAARLLQWTLVTGVIFSLGYFLGLDSIVNLLTDNESVRLGVKQLTLWVSLIPLISCWAFIFDGFYIGLTDTFRMMISSVIGAVIFFLIIFLGPGFITNMDAFKGNLIIWGAFLSYLLLRGVYLASIWPKASGKLINLR